MKTTIIIITISIALVISVLAYLHNTSPNNPTETPKNLFAGKRVVWVNSYHKGYVWSDSEFKGAEQVFRGTGVKLKHLYMNTKLNIGQKYAKDIAKKLKKEIDAFNPDVIIAADDTAQKYLIVPYYLNTPTPVVFCGVNWNASEYGYPADNVTGIIEVELIERLMGYLYLHAKGRKIAFVASNDFSEQKVFNIYNSQFLNGKLMNFIAKENTFESFSKAFLEAQEKADLIIMSGNASIVDWDDKKAIDFFHNNTKKPTGTPNYWMIGFNLISYSRIPEEQGEWAAKTALKIMSGVSPKDIPIAKNQRGHFSVNIDIAEKIGVVFSPSLLKDAELFHYQSK